MKRTIVVLFLILLTSVFAQSPVSKGTYTVGGNISYSSYSDDNSSSNNNYLIFSPNLGYFFVDNFYTGMSILYSYQSSGDYSSSTYGFGPILRYYFDVEKVKPFLGIEYTYSYRTSKDDPGDNKESMFTFGGGIDYFITNYFAIEGSVNYSIINHNYDDGINTIDFDSKLINVGIGAKYFIH